jgi:hypothetical protein
MTRPASSRRPAFRRCGALPLLFAVLPLPAVAAPLPQGSPPPAADAAPPADRVGALLARARAAHGIASFAATGQELLLAGTLKTEGMEGRFSTRLAADGRFASEQVTEWVTRDGHDGATTWFVDWSGMPALHAFGSRELTLLDHALSHGLWPAAELRLVVASAAAAEVAAGVTPDGARPPALALRAVDGFVAGTLTLDPATSLPTSFELDIEGQRSRFRYHDWRPVAGGLVVAHHVTRESDSLIDEWKLESARLVAADASAFEPPTTRPADVTFDPLRPAAIECRRAPSGHLLVHPRLDDRDLGWWIFDSGAAAACIDPEVADKLGLARFGELRVGGAGENRLVSHRRIGTRLVLGPVTQSTPRFIELDTDRFTPVFGVEIAGIVGCDLLQRVVATVDQAKGRIELNDPATFTREDAVWRDLVLAGGHAHVTASFGHAFEEEGMFRLDTGAGGVSVMFHTPFVDALELAEFRPAQPFDAFGGVGGQSRALLSSLPWFELGGHTFEEPSVVLMRDQGGALADPWTAGTIGSVFLDAFLVIFDYPHHRIGFVPTR